MSTPPASIKVMTAQLTVTSESTWTDQAACKALPHLFTGSGAEDFEPWHQQQRALATCRGCPVRAECLDDCLHYEAITGRSDLVAGGTTVWQRIWLTEHPEEAARVAAECADAKVSTDELSDWYEAVGPDQKIELDLKSNLKPKRIAREFGVRSQVYNRWVRARRPRPERKKVVAKKTPGGSPRDHTSLTALGVQVRQFLLDELSNDNDGWVARTDVITMAEEFLRDDPLTEATARRQKVWNNPNTPVSRREVVGYVTGHVLRRGLTTGWLEKEPIPGSRAVQIRVAEHARAEQQELVKQSVFSGTDGQPADEATSTTGADGTAAETAAEPGDATASVSTVSKSDALCRT